MRILLVTFSLRNTARDYSPFFVALRGNVLQWWHFIEQTCVVFTHHDASNLTKALLPHIEKSDSLLVVQIEPHQFQGWLPQQAWDWLTGVSEATAPTQRTLPPPPPIPKLPR